MSARVATQPKYDPTARTAVAEDVAKCLRAARLAQSQWSSVSMHERLATVRRFRHLLAERAEEIARRIDQPARRGAGETLAAEVIPVADACRFLEKQAARILRPRRPSKRLRPSWLFGVRTEIRRDPFGVILIIGPWNYPFMLCGVQALQALAAGNAVLLKPGRESSEAANVLAELLQQAGLPSGLLTVLDESNAAAQAAIESGVDKVILTGSARTGRIVLHELAEHLTPSTMELSGCDSVLVQASADLDRAAQALLFGLRINGSATCIAPRRVFVHREVADQLRKKLLPLISGLPSYPVDGAVTDHLQELISAAVADGAEVLCGEVHSDRVQPLLLIAAKPEMQLLREDVFAPVMSLIAVENDEEFLAADQQCEYALGATVFGEPSAARAVAMRINAGQVIVNDMIAPTADPRVPFGGRKHSGSGVTRGAEGLLEMTCVKALIERRGGLLMHLEPGTDADEEFLLAYLQVVHGANWAGRFKGIKQLIHAATARTRNQ